MDVGSKVQVVHGEMYGCIGEVLEIDRYDIALVNMEVLGLNDKPSLVVFRFPKDELKVVDNK